MIRIYHGEYQQASRDAYFVALSGYKNPVIRRLEGKTLTIEMLIQTTESGLLFESAHVVAIDNLFTSLGKKQKQSKAYAEYINKAKCDVLLWESKELPSGILKLFPNAAITQFRIPASIFSLLDALGPENAKKTIPIFRKLIESEAPEIVYTMILMRVRQLLMSKDGVTITGQKDWQIARLTRQAASFTMEKLLTMHNQLYSMDSSIKTGTSPFTLAQHIEQMLIAI